MTKGNNDMQEEGVDTDVAKVLIESYRESRSEAIQLIHSFFKDIPIIIGLFGVVSGVGLIKEPSFLLFVPLMISGVGFYLIAKYRVINLIDNHLLYLEQKTAELYKRPVLVWQTIFVHRDLSAGDKYQWGTFAIVVAVVFYTLAYVVVSWLVIKKNPDFFEQSYWLLWCYVSALCLGWIFNLLCFYSAMRILKKYKYENVSRIEDDWLQRINNKVN